MRFPLLNRVRSGGVSWRSAAVVLLVLLGYGMKLTVIDTAAVMSDLEQAPANSVATAVWDTTPPTATSLATMNGGSKAGKAEPGDSIVITFSEPIVTTSIKAGWNGAPTPITVTLENNVPAYGDDDIVSFDVNLGVIDLGHDKYTNAPYSTFGAQMSWDEPTLTLTVVLTNTLTDNTRVGKKKVATYYPDPGITDTGRVGIDTLVTPTVNARHF